MLSRYISLRTYVFIWKVWHTKDEVKRFLSSTSLAYHFLLYFRFSESDILFIAYSLITFFQVFFHRKLDVYFSFSRWWYRNMEMWKDFWHAIFFCFTIRETLRCMFESRSYVVNCSHSTWIASNQIVRGEEISEVYCNVKRF